MRYIPVKAKEIVDEHIHRIESCLPDFLESYYVYGSVALGAFKYGESDIDFIAVVKRKATETDLNILKGIKHMALLFCPKSVEWGVLGVSRLYYTFRERDITTKVGAGEYALQTVPHKWHKILKEAMKLRKGNNKTIYHSIFERRNDALHYMEYIIQECNKLLENNN